MQRTLIKHALTTTQPQPHIKIQGWLRTRRDTKTFSFLEINDGTTHNNIQTIANNTLPNYPQILQTNTGAPLTITGQLTPSKGKKQNWEIIAQTIHIHGNTQPDYPLQKKHHTPEYLRQHPHLRPRTKLYSAIFRLRSHLTHTIHQFFQQRHFTHLHTPIITTNDCEGAGQLFHLTTNQNQNQTQPNPNQQNQNQNQDQNQPTPTNPNQQTQNQTTPTNQNQTNQTNQQTPQPNQTQNHHFFGKPTHLTVSGQLNAEAFACALSNIYTLGPTFRAENSNTTRHANEFWMLEPEIAFYDLQQTIQLAQTLIQHLIQQTLQNHPQEIQHCAQTHDPKLPQRLQTILEQPFQQITHQQAIHILQKTNHPFTHPIHPNADLQTEHERYLTEHHFHTPLIIHNYPRDTKPFYMRLNNDHKTVAAMDILLPTIGEIIGGSQREERHQQLLDQIHHHKLNPQHYQWYLDLRKHGATPHSGCGLGLERLLMLITATPNIRDVIPYPRTPGNAQH